MRILFKILLFPITIILTIIVFAGCFLIDYCSRLLSIIAGIVFILAIVTFIMYFTDFMHSHDTFTLICGSTYMVIAWLLSPYGLPIFSTWVLEKLSDLNDTIKAI